MIKTATKATDLIGSYNTLKTTIDNARKWYNERTRWSVKIESTDPMFDAAHRWFTANDNSNEPPRSVQARLIRTYDPRHDTRIPEMRVYYDERTARTVTIGGHSIKVKLSKAGDSVTPDNAGGNEVMPAKTYQSYLQPDVLAFHAITQAGQQAVLDMLERLTTTQTEVRPGLWLLNSWGSWDKRDDLPQRTLDSVVLREGQMERIRDDLEQFLSSESEYNRRGIPWHRGYLLSGPPGTGKTSIVRALAAHFGLDLWYAPLGDVDQDSKLLNLIAQVRQRSILLLEDVDVFASTTVDREDVKGNVSMAGLLNALDGVSTPHGLISIMTSNHAEVIDEALIRPGRIDLREEVEHPNWDQVRRLYNQFYGTGLQQLPSPTPDAPILGLSTADYVEIFKRHMVDPEGALRAIAGADSQLVAQGGMIDVNHPPIWERLNAIQPRSC